MIHLADDLIEVLNSNHNSYLTLSQICAALNPLAGEG
jgi:hypothetical protein